LAGRAVAASFWMYRQRLLWLSRASGVAGTRTNPQAAPPKGYPRPSLSLRFQIKKVVGD